MVLQTPDAAAHRCTDRQTHTGTSTNMSRLCQNFESETWDMTSRGEKTKKNIQWDMWRAK